MNNSGLLRSASRLLAISGLAAGVLAIIVDGHYILYAFFAMIASILIDTVIGE